MTEQVSFSSEAKKITNKSNGNTEVLLTISNSLLKGILSMVRNTALLF